MSGANLNRVLRIFFYRRRRAMKLQRRFKNMNVFRRAECFSMPRLGNQILVSLLSFALLFATGPQNLLAYQDAPAPAQAPPPQAAPAPPYTQQTPEQIQELVAPIALYPDSLVAQILAASTFPEQVVQADRWLQAHPDLKGEALAKAVDQQPWDASVKALTAFPPILGNMDKNLSWTSSLGDAYYNQGQDVMAAVQEMRRRAEAAGTLTTTPQQTVTTQGPNVVVQPANPDVVYVPEYDPWLVYGYPVVPWPGWYPYPGIWFGGPYLSFGFGFGIGFFGGFGWGWPFWGCNWFGGYPLFHGGRYFNRSATFFNRGGFYRGAGGVRGGLGGNISGNVAARGGVGARTGGNFAGRGGAFNRSGATSRAFNGNTQAARGYAAPRGQTGVRSGAFSGFGQGGQARSFSSRGSASFGGGGFHGGGGGGFHGGGGGGGHR
jgi:hypothetical protein